MAIPILTTWKNYFNNYDEGLGSSYERVVLNNFLKKIIKHFRIDSILEAPSFGFTGLSGINTLEPAINGIEVSLLDHDNERIELIRKVWLEAGKICNIKYVENYSHLPFMSHVFDLSWNFSAIWFVKDLENFINELNRVTKKVIIFCIPNVSGIGYLSQEYFGRQEIADFLQVENLSPDYFGDQLEKLGWQLLDSNYIDCPPWPDIGMPKEKFLDKFGISIRKEKESDPLTIMDMYTGVNPEFDVEMMKYYWFEHYAPGFVKKFWAHHKYFIFVKK